MISAKIDSNRIMRAEEFSNIRNAGFDKTYSNIRKALKYFESDPEICCSRFRQVLESFIDDLYKIKGRQKDESYTTAEHITHLQSVLSDFDGKDDFIREMHVLRTIGNKYNHNGDEDADPIKDRYTCYCATRNIAEMLVSMNQQILETRRRIAENPHTLKEAEKKWMEQRKKIRAEEAAAKQMLEEEKVKSEPERKAEYRSGYVSDKSNSKVNKSPQRSSKGKKSNDKIKLLPILSGAAAIAGAITYLLTRKK